MSTGVIIAIVVVVVVVLAAAFLLAPMARRKRRERELGQRRERAVETHTAEADTRDRQATQAEQRARVAAAEAERQRAEANLHRTRADEHEQGLADHELVADDERDRFAGTSAVPDTGDEEADATRGVAARGTSGETPIVPAGGDAGAVSTERGEGDPRTQR